MALKKQQKLKIYVIAGEASGDIYGGKLIDALNAQSPQEIDFYGIGGETMEKAGIKSLFPMQELSIMGFWEIVPHIPKMLKRINQTADDILNIQPDVVITIDSPGFCCRVAEKLKGSAIPLIHYVAPTVWAYKPKRAQKFANLFDHLLLLLPFEKPYFDAVKLPCTFVGHPIVETKIPDDAGNIFRKTHNISSDDKLLCIMPGSRKTEIKKLLPTFLEAADNLKKQHTNLKIIIPTIKALKNFVAGEIEKISNIDYIILDDGAQKHAAYAASDVALVKSGTGSFEVAIAGCPMVIAYKVSYLSHKLIKMMIKIKYANLINIISNAEIIPELLQNNCTAANIERHISKILNDPKHKELQLQKSKSILEQLGINGNKSPSQKAADAVIKFLHK